jgi:hypothetical protein
MALCCAYSQDDPCTSHESHDNVILYPWSSAASNQNLVLWSYELPANHPLSSYQRLNTTLLTGKPLGRVNLLAIKY